MLRVPCHFPTNTFSRIFLHRHLITMTNQHPISSPTPVLSCHEYSSHISFLPSASSSNSHPLDSPSLSVTSPSLQTNLERASLALRSGLNVAFPTETVYGLGGASLDPTAVRRIYTIKGRPSDNPLIMHVSSLDMLRSLLPSSYTLSPLLLALISAFWPGPLTLLFPSPNPPPPPAPSTNAIRMPSHLLARALIHMADTPISAPSANASGRPSPTRAQHVAHDLSGSEGLDCILDGGECGVGVESTVVNALQWKSGVGGVVDVLRPGGLGVEEIANVVKKVDAAYGGETKVLVHGKEWQAGSSSMTTPITRDTTTNSALSHPVASIKKVELHPSTPGQKYRHYSPRIPVFLLLPSNVFPRPSSTSHAPTSPFEIIAYLSQRLGKIRPSFGFMHFEDSPLSRLLLGNSIDSVDGGTLASSYHITPMSLGVDTSSAAQRLFSGMLSFEGGNMNDESGSSNVDAILIEGCTNEGLGLAVMERAGKAVGGGGVAGDLGNGQVGHDAQSGRFWVQV